ncbi:MAG TPA: DegT/DnrJ/EryC1/StrS family aminotransferase [Gaiellaceae bacterium]|nr:DegT/DnrJ/EryC1/StrS family aminotransferase [Gaiellaceae bacterium]
MTRVPFLDLSRHVAALRPELDAAIAEVLDAGRFVGGEPVERFEREFAGWVGAEHAVAVASGTDAVEIALRAVGIGAGDEVITVANTCVPTVAGIEASGATPVLVDAHPESMTIDPGRVAAAVGSRTRAIVPVHLYGRCADMDAILAIAAEHGLKVVEDSAQAHGATWAGKRAGTLGDAAAFSFYPTKNLGAFGDAGAVVTSDRDVADVARTLRSYGEVAQYETVRRGTNSRLDTLQAAILSLVLRHVDAWTERRRQIAARYSAAAAEAGLRAPQDPPGGRHAYHLYVVPAPDRDAFRSRLADSGVQTLVHYPRAIQQHEPYREIARAGDLAVSERLAASVVSLPLYPELEDDEVALVADVLAATG